jgi:hypothetical protein
LRWSRFRNIKNRTTPQRSKAPAANAIFHCGKPEQTPDVQGHRLIHLALNASISRLHFQCGRYCPVSRFVGIALVEILVSNRVLIGPWHGAKSVAEVSFRGELGAAAFS